MGGHSLFFQKLDQLVNFPVGNKGALNTGRFGLVRGNVEHISASQKFFGAGLVDDDFGIDHGGNGKGNPGGNIGFDQAGDNIHGGTLGGQN